MCYSEIHIWGDSIARGVMLDATRGRYVLSAERCSLRLKHALTVPVVDHSVMGATVTDGFHRFTQASGAPDALCVIEFGGNDCDLNWAHVAQNPTEPVVAKVPLNEYSATLRRFVREARLCRMEPLLVTPPPLDATRYFRWVTRGLNAQNVLSALGDVQHIYRWQERYAIAMRAVATEMDCRLLDMRDAFLAQPNEARLLSGDGIHPSDAGHRLIADTALEALARRDVGLLVAM